MTLTDNEKAVLDNILNNDFVSSRWKWNIDYRFDQLDFQVWHDCIGDSSSDYQVPKGKALSGTVSSLVKKGLLVSDKECVWLTEEGFTKATAAPDFSDIKAPSDPEVHVMKHFID